MPPSLQGRAQKAARQKADRFRNLYGMRNEEVLRDGWRAIRKEAAGGVDHVSAQAYEQNLAGNIRSLVERLRRKRSRATLVKRHSMPKGDGPLRPLGIPAVEDTLVQLAVARLLEAMYAQDFLRWSYGYRPEVGALEAGDKLTIKRQCGRYNYVVEADIKGFFDNIDHDGMMRRLAERSDDQALLRLVTKWLKAGSLHTDGTVVHPATGTPQGGTVTLPTKLPTCW